MWRSQTGQKGSFVELRPQVRDGEDEERQEKESKII